MAKFFATIIIILSVSVYEGFCGLVVGHSPENLKFRNGSSLRVSNLDDVIAASLGYTSQHIIWSGLTVINPFKYPSALVLLEVQDATVPIKLAGTSYELKENTALANVYDDLHLLLNHQAERAIHIEKLTSKDLVNKSSPPYSLPAIENLSNDEDSVFLNEMKALPNVAAHIEPSSVVGKNGQDVVFVEIDSFAPLVTKYGEDSKQVAEASDILRSSIVETISRLRRLYNDDVVVMTAMVSEESNIIVRRKRATISDDVTDDVDYHLATVYDKDFPVIFNIVLIIAVVLTVALIAISMSMAFMDPGRDSIIYRMTNPRMKKDQ